MHVTEEKLRQLAEIAGIKIAPEHMPGVIRNLEVLFLQTQLLFDEPLDPVVEPAPVFRP